MKSNRLLISQCNSKELRMRMKLCSRETKTLNIADYKVHLVDTKIDNSFNYQTWRQSFIVCTETKGYEKKRPLELQSTNRTTSKIQNQHRLLGL